MGLLCICNYRIMRLVIGNLLIYKDKPLNIVLFLYVKNHIPSMAKYY